MSSSLAQTTGEGELKLRRRSSSSSPSEDVRKGSSLKTGKRKGDRAAFSAASMRQRVRLDWICPRVNNVLSLWEKKSKKKNNNDNKPNKEENRHSETSPESISSCCEALCEASGLMKRPGRVISGRIPVRLHVLPFPKQCQ